MWKFLLCFSLQLYSVCIITVDAQTTSSLVAASSTNDGHRLSSSNKSFQQQASLLLRRGGGSVAVAPPKTRCQEEFVRVDLRESKRQHNIKMNLFEEQLRTTAEMEEETTTTTTATAATSIFTSIQQKLQSSVLGRIIRSFIHIHHTSPTLTLIPIMCLVVTLMWHMPIFSVLLDKYFVLSRYNVLHHNRYISMLLSSISHISISHLIINLFSYVTFGSILRLQNQNWYNNHNRHDDLFLEQEEDLELQPPPRLWPLVVGSSIVGSCFFLLQQSAIDGCNKSNDDSGCIGLSGVTLALFAVLCKMYPNREIGVLDLPGYNKVPIKYDFILNCLILWSLLGSILQHFHNMMMIHSSLAAAGSATTGIAHATHLGGIVFGIIYYKLLNKR